MGNTAGVPRQIVHPNGVCENEQAGPGTGVWAFAHVLAGTVIGEDCSICDNAYVEGGAIVGDRVTVKNQVLILEGVTIEDDAEGYAVSVICPEGPGDSAYQKLDGVQIYKYRLAPKARGLTGFVLEFSYSWLRTAWLSTKVWRHRHFDVFQACNPPDTYWLLAQLWRGQDVKFVFDQHDLNPEPFLSRFGEPNSLRTARLRT